VTVPAFTAQPRTRRALAWLIAALAAAPLSAGVIEGDLRELLRTAAAGQEIAVLVSFAPDEVPAPTAAAHEDRGAGRARLVRQLRERADAAQLAARDVLERHASRPAVPLWAINALAVTASPEVVGELAAVPGVTSVRLDAGVPLAATATGAAAAPAWNLALVHAPEAWTAGPRGAGAVVAVLDTGVDGAHPDLAGRYRGGANSWFDAYGIHATPADRDGHGTRAAGLVLGAGGTGVAPHARWIAAKVFDDGGVATLSGIHTAFQWLLDPDGDPDTDDAPDVVSNSWGLPETAGTCVREFEPDIAVLRAAGIAVVFAAGNDGPTNATSVSPANNPGALAVGAVDSQVTIETSSSRGPSACGGPFPHLVAPGVDVRTTDLSFGGVIPDSYVNVTGTSFAAPHVAGASPRCAPPTRIDGRAIRAGAHRGRRRSRRHGADATHGAGSRRRRGAEPSALIDAPACRDTDGDGFT
jgi:bacillopeptidase F